MPQAQLETEFLRQLPEQDGKPFLACGKVRIDRELSVGRLSVAYLAHHLGLELPMILRVMRPDAREHFGDLEELLFAARQIARVRHQNIATIYDMGFFQGHPYMLLEYVSGVPMAERMKLRPFTVGEALSLLTPIAEGLAAYWRRGLLHRGVSPYRISISADGLPMLDIVVMTRARLNPLLTAAHGPYMAGFWAPEELGGEDEEVELDPRGDMFSFGATFYFAVTGGSPFGKGTPEELLRRTAETTPLDPREKARDLHPDAAAFIMRCLQRDPAKRFGSISEFQTALQELQLRITHRTESEATQVLSRDFQDPPPRGGTAEAGAVVGNCQLLEKVGSGAFGVVFRARHRTLDIDVAVKLLPLEIAAKDPSYVAMFLREARTAARIRHPNVIGIFEAGEQQGQYYLVMEYAAQGTLAERVARQGGKLPLPEVKAVFLSAARGLAAAEKIHIIHRDIKPENLMFGGDGELKIADLGLARRLPNAAGQTAAGASLARDLITMNEGGSSKIMGTPAYMSPEMALDPGSATTRSDLYSLGVTIYEILTGRLPFRGNSALETILKHVQERPQPPEVFEPATPPALSRIILRLLEKDPKDRYPSALELVKALEALEE